MKKLWIVCWLLLATAGMGMAQTGSTVPESTDTVFMRFENYVVGGLDTGSICVGFDQYCNCEAIVRIETERGISISRYIDHSELELSFGDSLRGCDFTVKMYDFKLSGIACHVTSIYVDQHSNLVELSITNSSFLRRISCEYNQLTSLNVSGYPALAHLSCCGNQLTSLDVSGCPDLEDLSCEYNQLASLDVSGCTALTDLRCDGNRLTSLDVSDCMALKTLICSDNQLTSLDVSGCPTLHSIACDDNQLTSLELGAYTQLQGINCMNNRLKYLDLGNIKQMYLCFISGNFMSELRYEGKPENLCEMAFGDNKFRLHECYELFKLVNIDGRFFLVQGNSQYISASLAVDEPYDFQEDMALDGQRSKIKVMRKGSVEPLDPKWYRMEDGLLSFPQKGEYTVEMTNSKLRENIHDDAFWWAPSVALISVFLDVQVGMGDDPTDPDNPTDPDDPDDPTKPTDTTANEALGVLTSAALQVYPNPATDVLHVALRASGEGVSAAGSAAGSVTGSTAGSANAPHAAAPAAPESLRTVRILSAGGNLYHSFSTGFDHLNVGDLPAGIYLLEAETTAGTVLRHKFVKR